MDENAPAAAGEAPQAPQTEATPTLTNSLPVQAPETNQAPDMHGFTSDQLAEMKRFYDANGGFEKVKSRISNPQPQPAENPAENFSPQQNEPIPQAQPQQPVYRAPKGAITAQEFLAEQYFKALAGEEKYSNISQGIASGEYLKEMADFGIQAINPDGTFNDGRVRKYLDLKSQTVPAKPTETEPDASAAPTVTYTEVGEGGITSADQAYKILMEPGSPNRGKAEEYLKKLFNKQ